MTMPTDDDTRRAWLAVLAHAPREALFDRARGAVDGLAFETLRAPEVGLAMLRARIDGAGNRFNLGEATLARCVLRFREGQVLTMGVGYCLGRDAERARRIAELDALLQVPSRHATLMHTVVEPLRALVEQRRMDERRRTAASRVVFYTLQAEAAR